MVQLEEAKLDFAIKMAKLEAETKIIEMKSLLEHELKTMNLTMYAPAI